MMVANVVSIREREQRGGEEGRVEVLLEKRDGGERRLALTNFDSRV